MRSVLVIDICCFTKIALENIINKRKTMSCKLMSPNQSIYPLELRSGIPIDDVFVHLLIGDYLGLREVQLLLSKNISKRVIILLDKTHEPTLQLLLAMGVKFIISTREPVEKFDYILKMTELKYYISEEFNSKIKENRFPLLHDQKWSLFDCNYYLTNKETNIIIDLIKNTSPWNIAKKYMISIKTVSRHKINALKKIGLVNLNGFFIKKQHNTM